MGNVINLNLHSYFQDVSNKWLELLNTLSLQVPNHPQLNHLMTLYEDLEQIKFEVQYLPSPSSSLLKRQKNMYEVLMLLSAVLCQKILRIIVNLHDQVSLHQKYLEVEEIEEVTRLIRQVEQVNRMLLRLLQGEDLNTTLIKKMEQ